LAFAILSRGGPLLYQAHQPQAWSGNEEEKKNRKVRELKRLYPEINAKVMYAKDYKRLLEKFARGMTPERRNDGDKKTAPSDL
jgi:hypothetical protein